MTPRERLDRLDAVAAHLPFPVEDAAAATRAFARWATTRADDALRVVELWAYCFTQRYVLVRFVREPDLGTAADLDEVISATFLRVRDHLEEVHDAERFTHWVHVICRNSFVTFCRRRAVFTLDDDPARLAPEAAPPAEPGDLDRQTVRRLVVRALGRLPDAIREVARLRLLEDHSYEHLAAVTGHSHATLRAYVAKATARLRDDPELGALMRELRGDAPPPRDRGP